MRTWRLLKQSTIALHRNRLRSVLVILGVMVGIGALTVVVSITKGANRKVMDRVKNFGPTGIMLFAGGGRSLPGGDPSAETLTLQDAEAIESQIDGVDYTCPQVNRPRVAISYQDRSSEVTTWGVCPEFEEAWNWHVVEGEFFSGQDYDSMARVVVIGQTVAEELFAGVDPIGESLRMGNASYRITGVLAPRGTSPGGGDMDDRLVIPLTTAMRRAFNTTSVTVVRVRVSGIDKVESVSSEIRALLRERHRLQPPEPDDFRVVTPEAVLDLTRSVSGTLNTTLLAVTAISLLVGGVVLMNLMLLSVAERRHEIGLRRALGGKRRDVLLQFLFEAMMLTSAGGGVGLIVGIAGALVIGRVTTSPAEISWEPMVMAVVLSWVVGLVFGLLPARRASRLHPVEALR